MRIGILGGTFDPVHYGHLELARAAVAGLGLDRLIFVPAFRSPHKDSPPVASPEERLTMLRLACAGEKAWEVSDMELVRQGPSYTYDTLEEVARSFPEAELFFVLGSDSLADVPTWHRAKELPRLCRFAYALRPGAARPPAPDWVMEVSVPLKMKPVDVSATEVRRRVAAGLPIGSLVPAPVERYIIERGIYRPGGARGRAEEEFATLLARAADEKKALDTVVLDLRGLADFTDFFVICHGESVLQVQAVVDNLLEKAKEVSSRVPDHLEGYEDGTWVLVDFGGVIVHVFDERTRAFYGLERLWMSGRPVDWRR